MHFLVEHVCFYHSHTCHAKHLYKLKSLTLVRNLMWLQLLMINNYTIVFTILIIILNTDVN